MTESGVPLLDIRGLSKTYGQTVANDHIDLAIAPGEVHALLGENGAGKSTLVKIIAGLTRPDAGTLLWRGEPITLDSPKTARRLGIAVVLQHLALCPGLTVRENLRLAGLERRALQRFKTLAARYELPVDLDATVAYLSAGECQRLELLRCLAQDASLLVLDEPTAVLGPAEARALLRLARQLAREGRAVVLITHKLQEVLEVADVATILRRGRMVSHLAELGTTSAGDLAAMMVGELPQAHSGPRPPPRQFPALTAHGLTMPAQHSHGTALQGITMTVRRGEILGIAGVAGNGQEELLAALSGLHKTAPASLVLEGEPCGHRGIAARRAMGLAYVPGDRLGVGTVPGMTLAENTLLTASGTSQPGWIHHGRLAIRVREILARFRLQLPPQTRLAALSGGMVQRFLVGRELSTQPKVLIAAHPTWGVDVRCAQDIIAALLELRAAGGAVVVVSEDLDELFALSDRLAVLYRGRLSAAWPVAEVDEQRLARAMAGIEATSEPQEHHALAAG